MATDLRTNPDASCRESEIPHVAFGSIEDGSTSNGCVRLVRCDDGYQSTDPSYVRCINGTWTYAGPCRLATSPQSLISQCDPESLPHVSHGRFHPGPSHEGVFRMLECDRGFTPRGPSYTQCYNSYWTPPGTCIGKLVLKAYFPHFPISIFFLSTASAQIVGSHQEDDEIVCSKTPTFPNGVVSGGHSSEGSSRQVTCQAGYQSNGETNVRCTAYGWMKIGQCSPGSLVIFKYHQRFLIKCFLIYSCTESSRMW